MAVSHAMVKRSHVTGSGEHGKVARMEELIDGIPDKRACERQKRGSTLAFGSDGGYVNSP